MVPLPLFVADKVKAESAVEAKGLISVLRSPFVSCAPDILETLPAVSLSLNGNASALRCPSYCAGRCGTERAAFTVGDIFPKSPAVATSPPHGQRAHGDEGLNLPCVTSRFPGSETQNQNRTKTRGGSGRPQGDLRLLGECLTPTPGGRQSRNQNRCTEEPGLRGTSALRSDTELRWPPGLRVGRGLPLSASVTRSAEFSVSAERTGLQVPGSQRRWAAAVLDIPGRFRSLRPVSCVFIDPG